MRERERERERELRDGVSKIYTYKKNARARTFDCFDSFIVTVYIHYCYYIFIICVDIFILRTLCCCVLVPRYI